MNPLEEVVEYYPEILNAMPLEFNSHEFILELAHRYQGPYIRVLAHYADSKSPFMSAHGQLAKLIGKFEDEVTALNYEPSHDIFGNPNEAMVWSKR